jgi:hypothetical protein
MLSKAHLEAIIAAWPDDDGRSSDPEVYDRWIERCRRYDARVIQNALGVTRILQLSDKQKRLLEIELANLLTKKDITEISDAEILGRYELITEHISPTWVEGVVEDYKSRQKLN